MRSFLAATALALVAACTTDLEFRPKGPPSLSPTATKSPAAWVMSPDSFGPITVATTMSQALATGAYATAPSPCSRNRLDWRGQTYETSDADVDGDGKKDRRMTKPYRPTITFGVDGRPTFIDSGKDTVTDEGIRKADSVSRLQLAYGDDLIPGNDQAPRMGTFAVNGERSHLLYEVMYGKVVGFYIAAGTVRKPEDVATGRFIVNGTVTTPDKMPPGHDGVC